MHRFFRIVFTALLVFLSGSFGKAGSTDATPLQPTKALEKAQSFPCDFEVVVSEPNFCVLHGNVHDVDLELIPIEGICKGSATLRVSGLPKGIKKTFLPFSKIWFKKGMARATVRMDTAGMVQEKATSTLVFTASKNGVIREAKAVMMVDQEFDFSIQPSRRTIAIHERIGEIPDEGMSADVNGNSVENEVKHADGNSSEENKTSGMSVDEHTTKHEGFWESQGENVSEHASERVDKRADETQGTSSVGIMVQLLGTGCQPPTPVTLSLDMPLVPPTLTHEFSPALVTPPGESVVSFKMSQEPGMNNYGMFEANIVGCCTDKRMIRKEKVLLAVMPSFLSMPLPGSPLDQESHGDSPPDLPTHIDGGYRIESYDTVMKMLRLPKEIENYSKQVGEELATKGYIDVPEERIRRLKESVARAQPMENVPDRLTFWPADLKNTPFNQLRFVGGYPWGGEDDYGKSTMVSRLFTTSDGAIVKLAENDLATSGGGAMYAREVINENINGFPAIFVVEKGPSGNGISQISWTSATTDYDLEMEGDVKANGRYEFFLNLARSITERTLNNKAPLPASVTNGIGTLDSK